jgi:hypothetical protein
MERAVLPEKRRTAFSASILAIPDVSPAETNISVMKLPVLSAKTAFDREEVRTYS